MSRQYKNRPNVTDWNPFGRGYQCTVRKPYHDLEVWPEGDNAWRWVASRMDPSTGTFCAAGSGVVGTRTAAQDAALAAVLHD